MGGTIATEVAYYALFLL